MSKSYQEMTLAELRMEYERQERRHLNSIRKELGPPPEFWETSVAEDIHHEIELRQKYEGLPELSKKEPMAEFLALEARVLIDVLKAEKSEMAQNELEMFACLLLGAHWTNTSGNEMQNKREWAKDHPEKYRDAEKRVREKLQSMKIRSANCQFPRRIERWLQQSGNS